MEGTDGLVSTRLGAASDTSNGVSTGEKHCRGLANILFEVI